MTKFLFNDGQTHSFIENEINKLAGEIIHFEDDYILNVDEEEVTKYLFEKYNLEVPKISTVGIKIQKDGSHSPRGIKIKYYVPFEGDREFLKLRPNSFNYSPPVVEELGSNEIIIELENQGYEAHRVNEEFKKNLDYIQKWLGWVETDINQYNSTLNQLIRNYLKNRIARVRKDKELMSGLEYPLKENKSMPKTYAVPEIRKKFIPKPVASSPTSKPEPTLDMEMYEHILKVCTNMSLVFERSPTTFNELREEDIRNHFLVQLNGHFDGEASGETFNHEGRTDILIRHEGKNLFIAECKFWKGRESLDETINQILKYTSWRDTKTAIFIFNKNKDTSKVLEQIPSVVSKHPNYKRTLKYDSETGFRFIVHQNNDNNREVYLTILVFDIPQ